MGVVVSGDARRTELKGWIDRQVRRTVDLFAFVLRPDGRRIKARITNLSYDGC